MDMVKTISVISGLLACSLLHANTSQQTKQTTFYAGYNIGFVHQRNSGTESVAAQQNTAARLGMTLSAFKPINSKWEIGSGVEVLFRSASNKQNIGTITVWRMLHTRYKLSNNWQLSNYFSLGRFARENPAYGYGVGTGLSYTLNKKWYIDLTANYLGADASIDSAESFKRDTLVWGNIGMRYRF